MSKAADSRIADPVVAIEAHGRYRAAKAALFDERGAVTYGQLTTAARLIAIQLRAAGVRPGDRVVSALAPSVAYAAFLIGVLKCGCAIVPLNTRLSRGEVDAFLAPADPTMIVADAAHVDLVEERWPLVVAPDAGRPLEEWAELRPLGAHRRIATPPPGEGRYQPALILGTGGTTGLPKAAAFSRPALAAWCTHAAMAQRLRSNDVELYASPFFHGTVVTSLLAVLAMGATAVIVTNPADPRHRDVVVAAGVTRVGGAPSLLSRLADGPLAEPAQRLQIRTIQYGTTAPPASFVDDMAQVFPSAELVTGYGATEFGPVTRLYAEDHSGVDRGVGRPVPHAELGVVVDGHLTMERGPEGELAVRCPWQMDGYWNDPAATAAVTREDGFLLTGDVASFDDEGYLHLRGRRKDIIITGGENVHPGDVERVLGGHPSVAQIAAYGVADAEWGERVEAAVVLAPGEVLVVDDLRQYARMQLAGYKFPKVIRVVDALPLTTNLKVDRAALRRAAEHGEGVGR